MSTPDVTTPPTHSDSPCSEEQSVPYTGHLCREELWERQHCPTEQQEGEEAAREEGEGSTQTPQQEERVIHIPSGTNQSQLEEMAGSLVAALPLLNPSPACEAAFRRLLCVRLFGVCGGWRSSNKREEGEKEGGEEGGSSPARVGVGREECEEVSVRLCPREWEVARRHLDKAVLPDCSRLPRAAASSCSSSGETHNHYP